MVDVSFRINDKVVVLKCDPQHDEILDIKTRLYEKNGFSIQSQQFRLHGSVLSDDSVLNDYDYEEGDEINVSIVRPVTIEIVGPGKVYQLDYNGRERVDSLIQKVANFWEVEKKQVQLTNWKNVIMLNPQSNLIDYHIESNNPQSLKVNCTILPADTIKITVQSTEGGFISVDIAQSKTVGDLKNRIGYLEGRHAAEIRLMFRGKQINDEVRLSEYGIGDNSMVYSLSRSHGGCNLLTP
ncbi:hypothetical protein Aperf_G00000126478 [Anoplocephala perfoliata]